MLKLLFVIPARGGSKGLPGKNLAILGGIPLVGRIARAARSAARTFSGSRIVCSTDDPEIAATAREWGAETPFVRPCELATDEARSVDVVIHALDVLGEVFDAVVLLQPTSPLVEAGDICGAVDLYRQYGSPVVSVCRAEHPIEWLHRIDDEGRLAPILPTRVVDRRQEAERFYRPNGAVYVASPEQTRSRGFWTPETRGFVMPIERSVDVDMAWDLFVAQSLLDLRTSSSIGVAGRRIGFGHPCFVIAEAGVNHNGSLDMALELVDAAASAGADAVKFQTFRADKVVIRSAQKAPYQLRATGDTESQFDMLRRLELDITAYGTLARRAAERGLIFLSTPFDEESADLLEGVGVPAFKVPSGELTNLPFLRHLARKGVPLIISTGMSTLEEVRIAVDTVEDEGCREYSLLHCVSNYPADPGAVNLRAMITMAAAFGVPVGYSDHTLGSQVSFAAVSLGARIIEKHMTLDRSLPGPDHQASADPMEIASLVAGVRIIEAAMGDGVKRPAGSESEAAGVARRSLVAACVVAAGTILTSDMVLRRRPGTGMAPNRLGEIAGRRALCDIMEGTVLTPEMFE